MGCVAGDEVAEFIVGAVEGEGEAAAVEVEEDWRGGGGIGGFVEVCFYGAVLVARGDGEGGGGGGFYGWGEEFEEEACYGDVEFEAEVA